jgi:hypothetical protein
VFELAHTSWWWVNKFMCHWIWFNLKFYMVWMLQSWNILGSNGIWNTNSKYNLNISCHELFTINQHKFLVSCFFCSIFHKTKLVTNVHEKIPPLSFFIHTFIPKYHSSMTHGRIFCHVTK